jgi:AraC-like DNA-binding protein
MAVHATALPYKVFTTSLVEPRFKKDAWRRELKDLMAAASLDPVDPSASLVSYDLGHIKVALQLAKKAVHLNPGDAFAFDLSKYTELQVTTSEVIAILLKRKDLSREKKNVHGVTLNRGGLDCRMLTLHMHALLSCLPFADSGESDTLSRLTVATLRHCLHLRKEPVANVQSWASVQKERILAYIDERLHDPALGMDDIQSEFRLSRMYVFRLFPGYGLQRYIRNRRIEKVFTELCRMPDQRLAVLVARYGFTNERQLQRVFLGRYGFSTSELRKRARTR